MIMIRSGLHLKLAEWGGIGLAMQVYMWGASSQVSAGDKYEGQFRNGLPHGSGRTLYADGGWHKVDMRQARLTPLN